MPFGRPPPPAKPAVEPLDRAARVSVTMPTGAPVDGFAIECSMDGGATWTIAKQVAGNLPDAHLSGLTNGTEYVCRVSASNDSGIGDFSPPSDAFRPCSDFIDCNPAAVPLSVLLTVVLVTAGAYGLWRFIAGRRVWVVAQIDNFASISLGHRPRVGMAFVRRGPYQGSAGVATAEPAGADVRILYAGGENFVVDAAGVRVRAKAGRLVRVSDRQGNSHNVVLRALDDPPPQ